MADTPSLEKTSPPTASEAAALLDRVQSEIRRVIVGQDRAIERLLVALLAKGHVLLEGVAGGEHQDARLDREIEVGAHLPADLSSVGARHRDVEADQVVGVDADLVERLVAVVGDVDGVALAAQAPGQGIGQVDLVFDHQQAHAPQATTARRKVR